MNAQFWRPYQINWTIWSNLHRYPYLRLSDNQYCFKTISEKFQKFSIDSVKFHNQLEVNFDRHWIRANFRENIHFYSESKDNSEWITIWTELDADSVLNLQ